MNHQRKTRQDKPLSPQPTDSCMHATKGAPVDLPAWLSGMKTHHNHHLKLVWWIWVVCVCMCAKAKAKSQTGPQTPRPPSPQTHLHKATTQTSGLFSHVSEDSHENRPFATARKQAMFLTKSISDFGYVPQTTWWVWSPKIKGHSDSLNQRYPFSTDDKLQSGAALLQEHHGASLRSQNVCNYTTAWIPQGNIA